MWMDWRDSWGHEVFAFFKAKRQEIHAQPGWGCLHIDDEWMFNVHQDFFFRLDMVHLLGSQHKRLGKHLDGIDLSKCPGSALQMDVCCGSEHDGRWRSAVLGLRHLCCTAMIKKNPVEETSIRHKVKLCAFRLFATNCKSYTTCVSLCRNASLRTDFGPRGYVRGPTYAVAYIRKAITYLSSFLVFAETHAAKASGTCTHTYAYKAARHQRMFWPQDGPIPCPKIFIKGTTSEHLQNGSLISMVFHRLRGHKQDDELGRGLRQPNLSESMVESPWRRARHFWDACKILA
jgi:hypothetical protein